METALAQNMIRVTAQQRSSPVALCPAFKGNIHWCCQGRQGSPAWALSEPLPLVWEDL